MKRFLILVLGGMSLATVAKSQRYERYGYGHGYGHKSHREHRYRQHPQRDYTYSQPSLGAQYARRSNDAPSTYTNNFRFGVFIAPNISWMKPTANKSDDKQYLVSSEGNKAGFTWGLLMDYPFDDNYGIATGFYLTTTGGKILATQNTNVAQPNLTNIVKSADFDYRLQYLEVPFALKLRSDEMAGGINLFGQMGLALGINISKKATYDVVYTDTSSAGGIIDKTASGEKEKLFGGLSIAPVMLSLNIGGGIEYALTNKMSLYLGLFFNNGFAPDVTNPRAIDMDYKGKFSDGNVRMNNFSLRVGLFF